MLINQFSSKSIFSRSLQSLKLLGFLIRERSVGTFVDCLRQQQTWVEQNGSRNDSRVNVIG